MRIFENTKAAAVETGNRQLTVFCSNRAAFKTRQIFANAKARHIYAKCMIEEP